MRDSLNVISNIGASTLKRKDATFLLLSDQPVEIVHLGFPDKDVFDALSDDGSILSSGPIRYYPLSLVSAPLSTHSV